MATCSEIKALIGEREKEKINVELKSFRKIQPNHSDRNENLREISYEIIALANRNGGSLIFGVNDDGTYDGKFEGNIDDLKRDIHNICYDNISPVIECNTQFIECDDGDLFIVYIPKRKTIPYAYVNRKEGKEIKSRIYYIRTSHGKKLVNDTQLEWLFKNTEAPNFTHTFRLAAEFNKQLNMFGNYFPHGNYSIILFLNYLNESDIQKLKNDSKKFYSLLIELFPYFILHSIADYYSHSWYIGIEKGFDRVSSGPINTTFPIENSSINIFELERQSSGIINTLSWDFENILKEIFSKAFLVPPETEIKIEYEKEGKLAKILWVNKKFSITINIGTLSAGAGLHQKSPHFEVLINRSPHEGYNHSTFNFYHFDGAGYLEADFNFPEYDIDQFHKHLHYFNTLKELINDNWNFDLFREQLPSKELLILDNKVDDILKLLQQKNNS